MVTCAIWRDTTTPSDGDEKARKLSKTRATVRRICLPIPMPSVFLNHLECHYNTSPRIDGVERKPKGQTYRESRPESSNIGHFLVAHLLKQCKCRHNWAYATRYSSEQPKRPAVNQRFTQTVAAKRSPCTRGLVDMFGEDEESDVFLLCGPENKIVRVVVEGARTSCENKYLHTHALIFSERPVAV